MKRSEGILIAVGVIVLAGAFWLPLPKGLAPMALLLLGTLVLLAGLIKINGRLGNSDLRGESYRSDWDNNGG